MSTATYFSRFGGLWTDRSDARDELTRRIADGRIDASLRPAIEGWMNDGFTILPGAVDPALCDALTREISEICAQGDARYLMQHASTRKPVPVPPEAPTDMVRLIDAYCVSPTALEVLFNSKIIELVRVLFDDDPVLFQSLTFEKGSQQGIHQDTAYVVVQSPMELAAAWVALEDVQPGSGELTYLQGSHRLPEFLFSGEYKHWNQDRDGLDQHSAWAKHLLDDSDALGFRRRTFLPRKGDVLIWSADLAHGGAPITDPTLTRRSIVGHYCPARTDPHYFTTVPDRVKKPVDRGYLSSFYYDLRSDDGGEPGSAEHDTPRTDLRVPARLHRMLAAAATKLRIRR